MEMAVMLISYCVVFAVVRRYRCMAIIDFQKEAKQIGYRIEDSVEKDLFKEILKLVLEDGNTEVKNMAAQW
jgi:hypothetical protein